MAPAVAGELLLVGSCSGVFYAFEAGSGRPVWSHDTAVDGPTGQFHGEILVSGERVVVGSDGRPVGHLYAFDRSSGALQWKAQFPGGVAADPLELDGSAIALAVSGEVVAIELDSGVLRWSYHDPPRGDDGSRPLDPALAGSLLVVPWRSGVVDGIDARTGSRLWRLRLASALNSSAARFGDEIVVGSMEGELFRIDPAAGTLLGSVELGGMVYGDPIPTPVCLLVLHVTGAGAEAPHRLACLEPGLESERWHHDSPVEWSGFRPLVLGNEVVAASERGVVALRLEDGALRWERPVEGIPRGLGASTRALYVGTLRGEVLALPWTDGGPADLD